MVRVAMTLQPCPVCGIPLGHRETCPSPSCPCYGLRSDSSEAELAALAWRARPSVAASRAMAGGRYDCGDPDCACCSGDGCSLDSQSRTMPGRAALEIIERGAWLDMMAARGRVIDLEVEHK